MELTLAHDYVLNPDASGKVTVRWEGDVPNPDLQSGQFLASEISGGKGIDAWRDLSCTIEDGKLKFLATAYFRDVAKLSFHCQGFHANMLDFVLSKDEKGNVVVRTPGPKPDGSEAPAGASDAELRERLAGEREKFAQAKEFIGGMMGGLVCLGTLQLPGKVGKVKNGKKAKTDTVTMRFEGKTIVDLLDRLLSDDELALRLLRTGKEGPEALLDLLGDQGPLEASTTGAVGPLFDYEAEAGAAKEAFPAIAETLNLPKPPELGPPMTNVRIAAAKLVREADSDRDLCPMGQNYPSFSFTVVGDLPEGAIKADEGRMIAAVTDAGENLVPDDEWKQRISFPKLSNDRKSAIFEVELRLGETPVEGFREIRGLLSIFAASGTEDVELGFKKLETGEEGKVFGARIERFEVEDEERATLEIKLQVAMETIGALLLVAPKAEPVVLDQNGYSSSGDECQLTYSIRGAIPKKAKLVARVSKNLQRIDVPFEVRDVDLLGRPRSG